MLPETLGIETDQPIHISSRILLHQAHDVAAESHYPSSKVGCVIISRRGETLAEDCNRMPMGMHPIDDDLLPQNRRNIFVHAEKAAIMNLLKNPSNAAAEGGHLLICTHPPCIDCAVTIVESK